MPFKYVLFCACSSDSSSYFLSITARWQQSFFSKTGSGYWISTNPHNTQTPPERRKRRRKSVLQDGKSRQWNLRPQWLHVNLQPHLNWHRQTERAKSRWVFTNNRILWLNADVWVTSFPVAHVISAWLHACEPAFMCEHTCAQFHLCFFFPQRRTSTTNKSPRRERL